MWQHSRLVISAFFWFHRHPRRSILSGKLAPASQSKNNKGAGDYVNILECAKRENLDLGGLTNTI